MYEIGSGGREKGRFVYMRFCEYLFERDGEGQTEKYRERVCVSLLDCTFGAVPN